MAFNGTQQKCRICDKNVYAAEMIAARGDVYHNTCFRCSQCNGKLSLSNYSSLEGILYCNPHFDQLMKEKGVSVVRSQSLGKQVGELSKTSSKLSSMFSGTQEKCAACKKTVYPLEKVTVDGEFYHKTCFKCSHGGCMLTTSNYAALDGLLYCKPHFSQLFKEKGSYNNIRKNNSLNKDVNIDNLNVNDDDNLPTQSPKPDDGDNTTPVAPPEND